MTKIAIVVALDEEYRQVHSTMAHTTECGLYTRGTIAGREVLLMTSGIGKVNAAARLTQLIMTEHPDAVINSGVAGGIGRDIRQGDIVVGTECAYHDVWCGTGEWGQVQGLPRRFAADEHLLGAAAGLDVRRGLIATGDIFIDRIETVEHIRALYPDALACDMESTAFAQVCYLMQVPFLSFRIISDTPGMEHDNTRQYFDFWTEAPRATFALLTQLIEKI